MKPPGSLARYALSLAIAVGWLALPCRALAQFSAPGPGGDDKALRYREYDLDSGEEIRRFKTYPGLDGGYPVKWTEATFPNGERLLGQCVHPNGIERPAVARILVARSRDGEVQRSEFDTLNPAFYPFLHRPLPPTLESLDCLTFAGLDLDAVRRGKEVPVYFWLNDAIYFRIFLNLEGTETLTVPAGRFEAARIRNRIDMTTLFPNLPVWAAKLMGLVFGPPIKVWVTRDPPYRLLKISGLPQGNAHRRTAQELIAIEAPPKVAPAGAQLIAEAKQAPPDPPLKLTNAASFEVGELSGRVVMNESQSAEGRLIVARTVFGDGLVIEGRALLSDNRSPRTRYMEQRTYTRTGALVQRKFLRFTPEGFPFERDKQLPSDLYPNSFALGDVLPLVRPKEGGEARFHILGFDGELNQLAMQEVGKEQRPIKQMPMETEHIKLRPIVTLPVFLKPLAYFLIPTFDLYLDSDSSHRVLEFMGPFGPPGSPSAHFVADPQLPSLQRASTN